MNLQKAVAVRMSKLLLERGMKPYELSKRSGLTKQAISNIMNEKYKSMKFETVIKIADGFNMTFQEFVDDDIFIRSNLEVE